jgi:hypothetical protein
MKAESVIVDRERSVAEQRSTMIDGSNQAEMNRLVRCGKNIKGVREGLGTMKLMVNAPLVRWAFTL